ncbi:hypothetical protein [Acidovorax sp. A1169]|uniref:hypothetical protein n=1 Tax=Acidovorax sp. A1169 TaxID=3059524 RepID=UPI0027378D73|nr:hypothetical protein [Acidovorax sp. A1169]MDP4074598.1 hypothetical protein [Acidovorax sp. A1169]
MTLRSNLRTAAVSLGRNLSTIALIAGLLLTASVLGATLWVAASDKAGTVRSAQAKAELLARMLEDQTTRTVETGFFAMDTLVEFASLHASAGGRERTEAFLKQSLAGLPFMRSLALVDSEGTLLPAAHRVMRDWLLTC